MTLHQPAAWARADHAPAPPDDALPRPAPTISLGEVADTVRRRWLPLSLWLACCVAAAGWYLLVTPPEFTASAAVILEPRRPAGPPASTLVPNTVQALDVAQAESQIQVIRSERVLAAVFDILDLEQATELAATGPGLRDRLGALLGVAPSRIAPADARARAYQAFEDRVGVRRLGLSYVLDVSYRAGTPEQAARIANAVTAQYLKAQIDAKAAAAEQGTEYLQGRISTLKAEQAAALQGVRDGRIPEMQLSDADARVIGAALRPLGKSSPKTGLILAFAATFGVLSGLFAVAIRQGLDRTFRRRRQVWSALGLECLAILPKLPRLRQRRTLLSGAIADSGSPFAQSFRALRTAVLLTTPRERCCSIGIVSCSAREGRTTVAAHLAAAMAVARRSVVLVDGDVLNPALTAALAPEALASRPASGRPAPPTALRLSDALGLVPSIAGSGRFADDGDLLSLRMQDVLAPMRGASDLVFDLPPLDTSPDALALAAYLDGVVLVIEASRTTIEEALEALRTLRSMNIHVVGVVLNKAEPSLRPPRRATPRPGVADPALARIGA